jgi:hypothetical protein
MTKYRRSKTRSPDANDAVNVDPKSRCARRYTIVTASVPAMSGATRHPAGV